MRWPLLNNILDSTHLQRLSPIRLPLIDAGKVMEFDSVLTISGLRDLLTKPLGCGFQTHKGGEHFSGSSIVEGRGFSRDSSNRLSTVDDAESADQESA